MHDFGVQSTGLQTLDLGTKTDNVRNDLAASPRNKERICGAGVLIAWPTSKKRGERVPLALRVGKT